MPPGLLYIYIILTHTISRTHHITHGGGIGEIRTKGGEGGDLGVVSPSRHILSGTIKVEHKGKNNDQEMGERRNVLMEKGTLYCIILPSS